MHKQHTEFLINAGKLIKAARVSQMDQEDLCKRVGISRSTLAKIENGKSVSATSMLKTLSLLNLLEPLLITLDTELAKADTTRSRKMRTEQKELSNDF